MLKILLILIISLNVFANEKLPIWVEVDPDDNAKYFRGISTWYTTDDYRMKKLSYQDAIKDAYNSLGNYFGMNIKSELNINKSIDNFGSKRKIEKNIKIKSNQFLFDIKPYKVHTETSVDNQHFRIYTLIKLDKNTESILKAQMNKDKREFESLRQKTITAIENKDFYKAETFLELAKGKRASFIDDTIVTLEKRLKVLKNGVLLASIEINKKKYLPKEEIKLEVSINKSGYLYLFYDTGDDIEMLFPNEFQRKAKLKANSLLIFPSEDIVLGAYEQSLNKDTKIFAITSKKNLNIKKYSVDKIDGIYIFEYGGKQENKIDRCIDQSECIKSEAKFKVSNNTLDKNIN